ncbi:MAG: iron ABC transporter substrate-binding protein [Armatimonadota bacterium]|nr:iron ABC transporter substrate-binding protein [Armatimonadota bacterium]MDR7497530.1 iron ABC transporter substrate-binding protein [Armatimonadota bacterium]MDR7511126.1 iron ABC transporter substrate-binding protein [Armatimonadota bacterium]
MAGRLIAVLTALALTVGGGRTAVGQQPTITVYSGRNQALVGPLLQQYGRAGGAVQARYGDTVQLAATIIEEGANSPADVYFAQDAGGLGYLAYTGRLRRLPDTILQRVEPRFRSSDGLWVGVTARARVVVYNTTRVSLRDLPASIGEFTDPRWRGRIGWAPTNASLVAHVTAMRLVWGNERTRRWLEGIKANGAKPFPGNAPIVAAVGAGEVDVGFVNNYYLFQFLRDRGERFPARNYMFPGGDVGNLVNVAGVGVLNTARNPEAALRFVEFLLSPEAQRYFAAETFEYPLSGGIAAHPMLPPLAGIQTPRVDLNYLAALDATLRLMREAGIL